MKLTKNKVFLLMIILFLSILIITSGVCPTFVRADDSAVKFDESNVLDDLKDMTLDGKKFSLEEYNFDTKKDIQILSFVEYCYSFYEEKQDDFGFYVYIYNPKGLKFKTDSSLNTIQFSITSATNLNYNQYSLQFLNLSKESNYYGLFYKFKVVLTEEEKSLILSSLNSTSRVYKVSGVQLVLQSSSEATEYPVESTFYYSGYAKGYGPIDTAESSLSVRSEFLETLPLEVFPTYYRPEGNNGKNDYTQDSLHSVYFAVPNKTIEQYGEMVAVHAIWLNAVLKPALVTGNQAAFKVLSEYIGSSLDSDCEYGYVSNYWSELGQGGQVTLHHGSNAYVPENFWLADANMIENYYDSIYMLFDSGSSENSADNYVVNYTEIEDRLNESLSKYGGNAVLGKYSEYMFESVDSEFTEKNIYADEKFPLNSFEEVLGSSWWEKLFGITESKDYSDQFNGIQAIYPVKDTDLIGSFVDVSNRLYISQSDVENLKTYYNANKENSTIYLFRYRVTDYISQEATLFEEGSFLGAEIWETVDTNAYFFQQSVDLNFEVIDVTLSTGKVETVIPVVMSPIDIIHDGTPPLNTERDKDNIDDFDFLKLILGLLLLILLLWFLNVTGALPLIGKILVLLITAPFKFIKWLIDKFRGK